MQVDADTVDAVNNTASGVIGGFSVFAILRKLIVTTTSLPDGVENEDYGTVTLTAVGGSGSYAWALTVGSDPLPTGLSLAANGDITGTPTVAGTSNFTVEVTSGTRTQRSSLLSITVRGVSVSVSPISATVELGQSQQFAATVVGTPNSSVTWSIDEGAGHGSVTAGGLFTAPGTLPSPATATVRATSVADDTKSATGSVTLSAGGGLSAEEKTLVGQLGRSGWNALLLSEEAIDGVVNGVFTASIANGGALTTTGTLTQAGDNSFSYSATPMDRFIVNYNTGVSLELFVTGFAGDLSSEGAFKSSHTDLTFRVTTGSALDLNLVSFASGSSYQRTISGRMGDNGAVLTVNLTHTGSVSGGIEDRTWLDAITGTASSDAGDVSVNASTEYRIVTFRQHGRTVEAL